MHEELGYAEEDVRLLSLCDWVGKGRCVKMCVSCEEIDQGGVCESI